MCHKLHCMNSDIIYMNWRYRYQVSEVIVPEVSILIPAYNVDQYIERCLDSILNQKFKDFEVVVVNDCSTDSTLQIIQRYAKDDPRIKVITNKNNRGVSETRNILIRNASGEFVAFIDPDDFVDTNYLNHLTSVQKHEHVDVVACSRVIYYDAEDQYKDVRESFANRVLDSRDAIRALNCYTSFDMSMWAKLIRRDLFRTIVFPKDKLAEDQFICYKILDNANSVYYTTNYLYYYRHRKGSLSRSKRKINKFPLQAAETQRDYLRKHYKDLNLQGDTACFFSAVGLYNDYMYIGTGVIPQDDAERIRDNTKSYFKSVIKNPDISIKKKMQACIFISNKKIYDLMMEKLFKF